MVDAWYRRLPPRGRSLRSRAFRTLYECALHEALDALEELELRFWLTEGTLIGLLRYGRNDSPATGDPVDHDVDVMVEVEGQEEWLRVADELHARLGLAGWVDAELRSTSRSPGARLDMMRIWRRGPAFARTRCDIHSYVADRVRGVAWSHGDAESYPFQRWAGFAPLGLIEPLRSCCCYERAAPAPNRPLDILRDWNDGEYGDRCLAIPRGRRGARALAEVTATARRLDSLDFCSMGEELARWGYEDRRVAP